MSEDQSVALVQPGDKPVLSVQQMLATAVEKNMPVESLERLVLLFEHMKAAGAKAAYVQAMSEFQGACPPIKKTRAVHSKDGSLRYRFAAYEDIKAIIQPYLHEYGLTIKFEPTFEAQPPAMQMKCIVTHVDGHSEESTFRSPMEGAPGMSAMQVSASAQSYAKRYALIAALDLRIEGEDDDAAPPPPRRISAQPSAPQPTPSRTPPPGQPVNRGTVISINKPKPMTTARDVLAKQGYIEPNEHGDYVDHEMEALRDKCREMVFQYWGRLAPAGVEDRTRRKPRAEEVQGVLDASARKHFHKGALDELDPDELRKLYDTLDAFAAAANS